MGVRVQCAAANRADFTGLDAGTTQTMPVRAYTDGRGEVLIADRAF